MAGACCCWAQAAPRASFLEETTYTRSFLLPRSVYTQINVDGEWERLLPYLGGGGPGEGLREQLAFERR